MTYYADYSPYSHWPDDIPAGTAALNVGWLEGGHSFTTGEPPEGFTDALGHLCANYAYNRMRGYHSCSLGHSDSKTTYPITAYISGKRIFLGDAEIRVIGRGGEWLIAPNLIYHYITEHRYLPSPQFIEAVLAKRTAPPSAW